MKRKYKYWTCGEIARLRPDLTVKQNAHRLGRSDTSVKMMVVRLGVKTKKFTRTMDVRLQAVKRFRDGESAASVAADFGVRRNTIHTWDQRARGEN